MPPEGRRRDPSLLVIHDTSAETTQAFVSFLAAILPKPEDQIRVRDGAAQLVRRLAGVLTLDSGRVGSGSGFFVGGALGRRTAILTRGALPTIDLFLALAPGAHTTRAADALEATAMAARALGLDPRAVGPRAVTLREDGLSFALIPAIHQIVGGEEERMAIPGRSALGTFRWIPCDPLAEAAALRVLGMANGERPRMLLAILKAWRSHTRVPLSGYALEVLVQAFFQERAGAVAQGGRATPQDLFESFMAWGRNATPGTFPLPGGGRRLSVGEAWRGPATSAYWRAIRARHLSAMGDARGAGGVWRELLGDAFPQPMGTLDVFPGR